MYLSLYRDIITMRNYEAQKQTKTFAVGRESESPSVRDKLMSKQINIIFPENPELWEVVVVTVRPCYG